MSFLPLTRDYTPVCRKNVGGGAAILHRFGASRTPQLLWPGDMLMYALY
jgi:hypothetical protein